MAEFIVQERNRTGSGDTEYLVVNVDDQSRPVASFTDRAAAEAHVTKLSSGPLDWDDQEAWKDDWKEDDDE